MPGSPRFPAVRRGVSAFFTMASPPVTLLLAPMEGVADRSLREILTRIGGYDGAVSEFVRVSGSLLPSRAYRRICPELDNGGRTQAGTPVAVQLLGSDPGCLADNATRLARLAPPGIDLNFGCPAKLVNRHGGGAMLLDEPERLHRIACAVRASVPRPLPVTAKMRLGVADPSKAVDCASALYEAGINSLVVHARTREQGYRAPAHWEWIARIRAALPLPVIANGEIWSVADWRRCGDIAGTADVMLGRGAVSDPWLALRIRGLAAPQPTDDDWRALRPHLAAYWRDVHRRMRPVHALGRFKMWLGLLGRTWPQARQLHALLRPLEAGARSNAIVRAHLGPDGFCDRRANDG